MEAALAVLLLGVLAAPAPTPPTHAPAPVTAPASRAWTEFTPTTGLFTVRLPGRPTEKVSTLQTAVGEARTARYVFAAGDAYFEVMVTEFPSGTTSRHLPQRLLDGARDGGLANIRGRAVEEFEVFLSAAGNGGAFPGRQVVAEVPPDYVVRFRLFLVNDTLIELMLIQKKAVASPQTFLKMADSFRLSR
jgi:hypothetical protein